MTAVAGPQRAVTRGHRAGVRRRVIALTRTEARLLWRFGAVAATVVATVLWVVLLLVVPASTRAALVPVVLLTDVAALGFLYVPALLLVEQRDAVDSLLSTSPVRTAERVGVRLVLLTGLSASAALAVATGAGIANVVPRMLGVVLLAMLFGLLAFAVSARATTLTDVLVAAPLVAAPLLAPALIHMLGVTDAVVLHLSPVTSAIDLLRGGMTWIGVAWLITWIAGVGLLVGRSGRRHPRSGSDRALPMTSSPRSTRSRTNHRLTHPGVYRTGAAVRSFIRTDGRTVLRHGVLVMLLASVPLLTIAMRLVTSIGVPWAAQRHGIALTPHLPLIEALILVVHTPVVFGSVTGLLLLEDRDAGLLGPLAATRAGLRTLLGYRLGATALLTAGALTLALPFDGVARPAGVAGALATAIAAGAVSVVPALAMAVTATNRVQGVAVMKGLSLPLYLPLATWVLAGPTRWAFAPLPTSWLVWTSWASTATGAVVAAAGAVTVSALGGRLLAQRFLHHR